MAYAIRFLKDSNDNPFYPRVVPESFDGEFSANNIYIDENSGFQSITVQGALEELKNVADNGGGYYIPSVDAYGYLTWSGTKDGMAPPDRVNIKGPKGDTGPKGDKGEVGQSPIRGVDYWTDTDKAEVEGDIQMWIEQNGYINSVDDTLSSTSENPVQNKVIYAQIGDISTALNNIINGTS